MQEELYCPNTLYETNKTYHDIVNQAIDNELDTRQKCLKPLFHDKNKRNPVTFDECLKYPIQISEIRDSILSQLGDLIHMTKKCQKGRFLFWEYIKLIGCEGNIIGRVFRKDFERFKYDFMIEVHIC